VQDRSIEVQLTRQRPPPWKDAVAAGLAVTAVGAGWVIWQATRQPGPQQSDQALIEKYQEELAPDVGKASPLIGTQGWVLLASKWSSPVIPVCWESLDPRFANERQWVADALAHSWEQYSAVDFTEFDQCKPRDKGVHVAITDGVSVTYGLGRQLDGEAEALLLNFEYATWTPECRDARIRQSCIRFHAVHEFGHALGFVHEHNRDDGPGICSKEQPTNDGDKILTPWDPLSVMNYCDTDQIRHGGRLSQGDRIAVAAFYGPRTG
jgi:hypothetical protein